MIVEADINILRCEIFSQAMCLFFVLPAGLSSA